MGSQTLYWRRDSPLPHVNNLKRFKFFSAIKKNRNINYQNNKETTSLMILSIDEPVDMYFIINL